MNAARWILAIWIVAGWARAGRAAEPGLADETGAPPDTSVGVPIQLEEALTRARAASQHLGALAALHTAAEASLAGARAASWPTVDLGAGYTRQSNVPELTLALPGSPPRTLFPNIPDDYRARASLAIPLYTGGRLSATEDAASKESTASAEDARAGIHDLDLETTSAFWVVLTARESARVLDDALASFDRHSEDARARESVGMAAKSDVLAVEVERERSVLARLTAWNQAQVANADLVRLVGADPGTVLAPVAPAELPSVPAGNLDGLVREALEARPEHRALAERLEAAEARVSAERSAYWPQAALAGGYDEARPNQRILPPHDEWDSSWDVGVNVSLDVFDFGRTAAAVAHARALADAASRQLADVDARIRQEVTARLLDLESSRSAVPVAERALASATESQRVSEERFREGVAPSSELLDAEVALEHAALERTRSIAAAHLAGATLRRALGR